LGDSNPCFRRERATSWAARRREQRFRDSLEPAPAQARQRNRQPWRRPPRRAKFAKRQAHAGARDLVKAARASITYRKARTRMPVRLWSTRSTLLALAVLGATGTARAAEPWLDPTLLDAAKKEGSLVIYSSV